MQVFQPFLHGKTVKKLLKFEIRHDHSLDGQKSFQQPPPDVLLKIEITLESTDNVPRL